MHFSSKRIGWHCFNCSTFDTFENGVIGICMHQKWSTISHNSWGLCFCFKECILIVIIVRRIINYLKILNGDEIKRILIWFDQKRLQQVSSIVRCWQVSRDFVGVPIADVKGLVLTCALIIIPIVIVQYSLSYQFTSAYQIIM